LPRVPVCCVFSHAAAPTQLYTLSLHDALPICGKHAGVVRDELVPRNQQMRQVAHGVLVPGPTRPVDDEQAGVAAWPRLLRNQRLDRKSTRLNSSHVKISYAVFCLKKKN